MKTERSAQREEHAGLAAPGAAEAASPGGGANGLVTSVDLTPPSDPEHRPDVSPESDTFDRDLSWLEFNRRVLHLALDERRPLLERVKFVAIFSSNLDEFVMKRIDALKRRVESGGGGHDSGSGASATELLSAIGRNIRRLHRLQDECFESVLRPALAREGIRLLPYEGLSDRERSRVDEWFNRNVFPVLTPLAVDPGHRFPFISNLSENLGILVADDDGSPGLFARVKVPAIFPQWVEVPREGAESATDDKRFVHLQEVIRHNLDDLFPGMRILEVGHFRLTRNAEVEADDEDADNLLELVEAQLRRRRFARAVRLEIRGEMSERMLGPIVEELDLDGDDIEHRSGLLDYRSLFEIADLDRPDLRDAEWTPVVPARLSEQGRDIFSIIRDGDLLLHHPYESFEASAQRFVAESARDPDVLAIKQTIYRTSPDSPFVASLIRAAESGKQVACLVELRARFDEQRNVRFARMLEQAGVHVAYGVVGLKTHCKASLVVRREPDGLRCYAHLGTGNYHPRTAQQYTDVSLFTCDAEITQDVVDLFNLLTGRSRREEYRRLLVAPGTMRTGFLELIDREIEIACAHSEGRSPVGGRIVAKMNALEDRAVMRRLYDASRAGVQITLYVRGFCCLRPGVPGLSENIRVVSVVGRFLEHSRIFHFGAGKADPLEGQWLIGSADWMHRNLHNRVESACPVDDREARRKLLRIFEVTEADRRCAWDLRSDGIYVQRSPDLAADIDSPEGGGTFRALMKEARRSVGMD